MNLTEQSTNAWTRTDTSPAIRAAGKVFSASDGAKSCLQEIIPAPDSPAMRRFNRSGRLAGKALDHDIASPLVHGVTTELSISAGSVINPPPKTRFQEKLCQLEEINYSSNQKAALGTSRVQGPGLPSWCDPEKMTFGVKTLQLSNVGEILNPTKQEVDDGHQLYVRSHGSYSVGERVDRNYNRNYCGSGISFGVPTPHHNDGRNVSRSLHWPRDSNRTEETVNVSSDQTFGVLTKTDSIGVSDILFHSDPGEFLRGNNRQRALLSAVRQHLKKANHQNFSSLLQAFSHYDKKGQGRIDKEDLTEVCQQFNLIISESVLADLMDYCDVNKDGFIDFTEFSNFLNWKDRMPINRMDQNILTRALIRPEDLEPVEIGSSRKTPKTLSRPRVVQDTFITSSSLIGAAVDDLLSKYEHTYGVPAVRTDLPAPRIKRISDRTNYGDVATAWDLLHPPLHSLYGVHEEQFFCPRSKDQIAEIFQNVGVNVCKETLEEAWNLASMTHPTGEVCVESFRNALCQLQAN